MGQGDLTWRAGTTAADKARIAGEYQGLLSIAPKRVTDTGLTGTFTSIDFGKLALQPKTSPANVAYAAWLKDFNAHAYYQSGGGISGLVAQAFIAATGVAIGGGVALGGVGTAGAASGVSGLGSSLSSAASAVGSGVSAAAGAVSSAAGAVGLSGSAALGVVKTLISGHSNELSPVSGAHSNLIAGSGQTTADFSAALPLLIGLVVVVVLLNR